MLDLQTLAQRLIDHPEARARLTRDYGFPHEPTTADELRAFLKESFQQAPANDPLEVAPSADQVLQAAVKALGSNMRPWAKFVQSEPPDCRCSGIHPCAGAHNSASEGGVSEGAGGSKF